MPSAPTRPTPRQLQPMPDLDPPVENGRWIGWTVYALLALVGFSFGLVVGYQKPKVIEVVKTVPGETKPEPKPSEKREPEKKDPPMAKMPDPMTPEPKPPEPKPPEPKPPEPKIEPKLVAVSFDKQVLPIFRAKCLNCHGAIGKPKGDLDLRTLASIAKGGDNGAAIKPGDLKSSLIWASIEDGVMPPADNTQLTADEKTLIKNWILSGGK